MSTSLTETLLDPARRDQVVAAIVGVIDSEVSGRSGLSGMALKTAYSAVKKINDSIVPRATNAMLPDVAQALQPFWDNRGGAPFRDYLASHKSEAADALLAVSDRKAAATSNQTVGKLYSGVRGKAKGYVEDALPQLGGTIAGFMA